MSCSASSLLSVINGVLLTNATLCFFRFTCFLLIFGWLTCLSKDVTAFVDGFLSCLVEFCELLCKGVDFPPRSSSPRSCDLRFSVLWCLFVWDFSLLLIWRTLKAKLGVSLCRFLACFEYALSFSAGSIGSNPIISLYQVNTLSGTACFMLLAFWLSCSTVFDWYCVLVRDVLLAVYLP